MAPTDKELVELFKDRASAAAAEVEEVEDMAEALARAAAVCGAGRSLAAPDLAEDEAEILRRCGLEVVRSGLRQYRDGLEAAFTRADLGLADTGACVLASPGEETRLATMLCRTHLLALPKAKILPDSSLLEDYLRELLGREAMYAAFITGPSRTADIERVLTIGVHGPLALRVFLLDRD